MLDRLLSFCDAHGMLPEDGGTVLCAVSGGADSVCMLHLMSRAAEKRGFTIAAAHFDHRLRGAESERDAEFTRSLCLEWGIECFVGSGDVKGYAKARSIGTEEAARLLRYGFLYETAEKLGAKRIATAHNGDDNAETVIMNLARGSGAPGLSGIPPVRDCIIRPILFASRSEIIRYLDENGIPHVEDSTNGEDIYTRNFVRHGVMPLVRRLNPKFSESVLTASELLRRDEDCLSSMAAEFLQGRDKVEVSSLMSLHPAVATRVVRLMFGGITSQQTEAVLALCKSGRASGSVDVTGGRATLQYGVLSRGGAVKSFEPVILAPGESAVIPELSMRVTVSASNIHNSFTNFAIKRDMLCDTVTVRPRRPGDSIRTKGGVKTLKKLFIERKVPRFERELVPVVESGGKILGVFGVGVDTEAAASGEEAPIFVIFEEERQHES